MSSTTVEEVGQRFSQELSILVAAHENPDGDALGCVSALVLAAARQGIAHTAYIPGETPFPPEYAFLGGLKEVVRGPFPTVDPGTTVYILDCASAARLDAERLQCAQACVNIDHHQDNTRFGTVNLVDPSAASTTEILYRIFLAGGIEISADIATALYVGLVTDTGRFQYANTTAAAHRMAAELQEHGVDVNAVYRRVYEQMPAAKMQLLGRALGRLELRLDGRLAVSWLKSADFAEVGAEESLSDGIIDHLRMIRGVSVAALVRERPNGARHELKGSLRSTDGKVNVADIAHLRGGGGHVLAAGFTANGEQLAELLDWLERETAARL